MSRIFSFASVLLLVLALLPAGGAQAGSRNTRVGPVVLSDTGASGVISTVRNSSNAFEYINCTIRSSGSATCIAFDAARRSRACNSTDAEMIRVIGTMRSDSYVSFTANSEGICTAVSVTTGSREEPKQP